MNSPVFRTTVSLRPSGVTIARDESIVLIGSCFADSVGALLVRDGFNACVNPMGALYNPMSMAAAVSRALRDEPYTKRDLTLRDGIYHCLDYESRRQGSDSDALLSALNNDFGHFSACVRNAGTMILTFGTSWVFSLDETGATVGNCHKLPATEFTRRRVDVDEITSVWVPLLKAVPDKRVILTVSPVRHLADGLHGNQLSKAVLLLAIEKICALCYNAEYFPSYEIALDDLRDYRFYAEDMKHLSPLAVEYIYSLFGETYFTPLTRRLSEDSRRQARRAGHRNILQS